MKRFVISCGVFALLAGCVTVDVMRLSSRTYPPRTTMVDVITTSTSRPYTEVAAIRLTGQGVTWRELVNRAQQEAAKLGADAIIVTTNTTYGGSVFSSGNTGGGMPVDLLVATAIVFSEKATSIE